MIVLERRASTVLFNLLRALRRPGRFLIPSNVCPIVPVVFLKANRSFEFIDILPTTLCLDFADALKRIEGDPGSIAGVVFVHTYGAIQDADPSFAAIKKLDPEIIVIDDRCLCPPSLDDLPLSIADAVLYSTGYAKFADIGFGGIGVLGEQISYARSALAFSHKALDRLTAQYKHAITSSVPFVYQDSDWLDAGPLGITETEYRARALKATERSWEQKKKLNRFIARSFLTNVSSRPGSSTGASMFCLVKRSA